MKLHILDFLCPHTPITNLVFKGDLGPKGVVGVPLLCEGQSVFRPLVLGLQGSSDLAGLSVSRACAGELLQMTVLVSSQTEKSGSRAKYITMLQSSYC